MSQYFPEGGELSKARTNNQSLLSVYLQSFVYYDDIFSYFAIIFQYFIFIYKYNILYYLSSTIAGELVLLTLLLPINYFRLYFVRSGNKGKKYSYLAAFLGLDILVIVGCIYIIAIQSNALYLEVIISIIELVLSSINFVFAIILMITYRINQ
jgi:hypothetical protein